MLSSQLKLSLSYYSDLYDMIVPKDHILRKIRELVDFSFIYVHSFPRAIRSKKKKDSERGTRMLVEELGL